jgi:hypothetical protein
MKPRLNETLRRVEAGLYRGDLDETGHHLVCGLDDVLGFQLVHETGVFGGEVPSVVPSRSVVLGLGARAWGGFPRRLTMTWVKFVIRRADA